MIKTVGVRTEKRNKSCFIFMCQAQASLKYVCKIFHEERFTSGIKCYRHLLFSSKYPTKSPVEEACLTYRSLSVYLFLRPSPVVSTLVARNQPRWEYLYHSNWLMLQVSVFLLPEEQLKNSQHTSAPLHQLWSNSNPRTYRNKPLPSCNRK